jgi:hypothetical protein
MAAQVSNTSQELEDPIVRDRKPPGPKPDDVELIGTAQVAKIIGRSPAWVKEHAQELGARMVGGDWRYPVAEVRYRAQVVREADAAKASRRPEPGAGERAAAIFERLEEGQSQSRIVRELREPPEFVARVREQWLACYEADRKGVDFRCECGAPSNPRTAHCDRCAPRTRTLTPAQIALLAGEELPPPGSCTCSGCGATKLVEDVERLCSECQKNAVGIVVVNGQAEIALRLSSGKLLSLRPLTPAELSGVASLVVPQAPQPRTPDAPMASTEAEEPLKKGAAIRSVEAVMQHASVGLSRLDELLEQERARSKLEKP